MQCPYQQEKCKEKNCMAWEKDLGCLLVSQSKFLHMIYEQLIQIREKLGKLCS